MQEIITGAVSLGLLWAVMTIGVYISYSVLGMADMTAEGSITMGAAIAAKVIAGPATVHSAPATSSISSPSSSCRPSIVPA